MAPHAEALAPRLALGDAHTCVLRENGAVFCVGSTRPLAASSPPTREGIARLATARRIDGLMRLRSIAAGGSHTCGITETGVVQCWDLFETGAASTPTTIAGVEDVTQLAVGPTFRCALTTRRDRPVLCWGNNEHGQLGRGTRTTTVESAAATLGLDEVTSIAVGDAHACATRRDGAVLCWGSNEHGQLGARGASFVTTPVRVEALPSARSVAAGSNQSCSISADYSVRCWGEEYVGDPHRGLSRPRDQQSEFVDLQGRVWARSVATAGFATCVLTAEYSIVCASSNTRRSLPDYTALASPSAERTDDVVQVGLSVSHGCRLRRDGRVECVGENDRGQLGSPLYAEMHSTRLVPTNL
jgi:alpha-tubulin suppressor-like RCC1 family protein